MFPAHCESSSGERRRSSGFSASMRTTASMVTLSTILRRSRGLMGSGPSGFFFHSANRAVFLHPDTVFAAPGLLDFLKWPNERLDDRGFYGTGFSHKGSP